MRLIFWILHPGLARDVERFKQALRYDIETSNQITSILRDPVPPHRRRQNIPVLADRRRQP